jgi:hypothetical protein
MKMLNFIQSPISLNLRDTHSKALEPERLSPPLAITTQALEGGVKGHNIKKYLTGKLRPLGRGASIQECEGKEEGPAL